jgi:hypothetical protein
LEKEEESEALNPKHEILNEEYEEAALARTACLPVRLNACGEKSALRAASPYRVVFSFLCLKLNT